jgi:hypothetical protein
MPKMVMVVMSEPTSAEEEAAYNAWYDDVHLPEMTQVPGVDSARRFKVSGDANLGDGRRYLAIYELDTEDLAAVQADIGARMQDGRINMSPLMREDMAAGVFEAI